MGGPERGGPHRSTAPAHGRRPWPRREAAELGHHVHPSGREQLRLASRSDQLPEPRGTEPEGAPHAGGSLGPHGVGRLRPRCGRPEPAFQGHRDGASRWRMVSSVARRNSSPNREAPLEPSGGSARGTRHQGGRPDQGARAGGVCMGSPHDRQPTDKTKDKGQGAGQGQGQRDGQEGGRQEAREEEVGRHPSAPGELAGEDLEHVAGLVVGVLGRQDTFSNPDKPTSLGVSRESRVAEVVAACQAATGLHQWRYGLRRFAGGNDR